jgi:uncharacterized protein (DUF1015 family)
MLQPFRGTFFDPAAVSDTGAVTSPPYDVIDDHERERLRLASPHNVVRLLLPEGGGERYQQAGRTLRSWHRDGVLVDDPEPRLYLYQMTWTELGRQRVARGVVGALLLAELGDRVLPHEETMAGTRADRLAVLEATRANLDPIVALSASPDLLPLLVGEGAPRVAALASGVEHELFDIAGDAAQRIVSTVDAHTMSIADGHHRYTTALGYAAGRGPGPWSRILTVVAPAQGSGLRVAPYHRTFATAVLDRERLRTAFTVEDADPIPPTEPGAVVLVDSAGAVLLRPHPEALDHLPPPWREASAAVARELLYPLLGVGEQDAVYTPDRDVALATAAGGGLAVLVSPVTEHAIAAASEARLRFPQKTTFFTPKPRAGLVLRLFDVEPEPDASPRVPG